MRLLLPLIAFLAAFAPAAAFATITVRAERKDVAPLIASPTEGFFDVFIETTGPNPSIGGFQVVVDLIILNGQIGVVPPYAKVTTNVAPPGGVQTPRNQLIAENFTPNVDGDNNALHASASAFLATGAVPAANGAGLMRVPFVIPAGSSTPNVIFHINTTLTGTALADQFGNTIPYSTMDGGIFVPEPAALSMIAAVATPLLLRRRR
jgi:hypothetical protein